MALGTQAITASTLRLIALSPVMSDKYGYGLRCECGHLADDHVRLPGHPDGASECYGPEDCACGHFLTARSAPLLDRDRAASANS
jgi:hypothetical protein